ncbi:MAG: hypothetical protein QOF58_4504 [Pseudonocardiales bacterium]|jgi:hypothetical protein|nr:hypothetical protein [Pseudonocardiales bacterium]
MAKICLTLPTNRACAPMVTAICAEAAYAVRRFGVDVVLLILDSSDEVSFARHAAALRAAALPAQVTVAHFDEERQRSFLREVTDDDDVLLGLMLPAGLSYGACTDRAFLFAAAYGCDSVHRRDSDSRYQVFEGADVFPIHQELGAIGRRAADVAATEADLDAAHLDRPVVLAGASFIGELSVDIGEIRRQDPGVYHDIVSLWAPSWASEAEKRELVDESFTGAGRDPFAGDRSVLTLVDPMRVDMCNVSFHQVHEQVPLPPATDTIGSDYFLLHLVRAAGLPGLLHNRHIVNFHTPERKSGPGLHAYHLRLAKFFLSVPFLHVIYREMTALGGALLDDDHRVHAPMIAKLVRESVPAARVECADKLASLVRSYRRLGGEYAGFADLLGDRAERLMREAEQDIENFAVLTEKWQQLVARARATRPRGSTCD